MRLFCRSRFPHASSDCKHESTCDPLPGFVLQAFRMQQESQAALSFLCADEKTEASPWDLAAVRASHAETVDRKSVV